MPAVSDMAPRTNALSAAALAILTLAALVAGRPAASPEDDQSGPLPLIQFTKGGIRVNFGGYHAQAGLGGFLTGNSKDGGLHASAGTPSGAHASAGLGGSLEGGPSGGLQARAGLGNGGPEAEAGLGGTLAGPRPQGEIYARSSPGNLPIPAISKTKGKNVQVIPPPKKDNEETSSSSSFVSSVSTTKSGDSANAGNESRKAGNDSDAERQEHPARWYFKKRLRERVEVPQPAKTTADNAIVPSESDLAGDEKKETTSRKESTWLKRGVAGYASAESESTSSGGGGGGVASNGFFKNKSTLFDDIFNIPISALKAVNQLLKNHAG